MPSKSCARTSACVVASVPIALLLATVFPAYATTANHYGLEIANEKTQNVTFKNGVFTAVDYNAILNVSDLENALANGNVEVTTGSGNGGTLKGDLHVKASLSWVSPWRLALDAYHSIYVDQPVTDAGTGALTITTNDGGVSGTLSFSPSGSITILGLSDTLTINGQVYTLLDSIASLANAIARHHSGYFALANSYDAAADGVYSHAPVSKISYGAFEGLGNTISNLSISDTKKSNKYYGVGLFGKAESSSLRDLVLSNAQVSGSAYSFVGALVGYSLSNAIFGCSSTGAVSGTDSLAVGGLIGYSAFGYSDGTIQNAYSTATVSITDVHYYASVGGLVGGSQDAISNAHATGPVSSKGGSGGGGLGGLVGFQLGGSITDTYATGSVTGNGYDVGGLVGYADQSSVEESFSTGTVQASGYAAGGLIGDEFGTTIYNTYSTSPASIGSNGWLGGLSGEVDQSDNNPPVTNSYSTGALTGDPSQTGGLVGLDRSKKSVFEFTYWNLDTSGVSDPSQGAANKKNVKGITGLTTQQLESSLPPGFSSSDWAEKKSINHGWPYLIANPPPQ